MIKKDFPIFNQESLHYLDSAASAQKPREVIEAISSFYQDDYANIHRGVYQLSQRATDRYESARKKVQQFIRAKESNEIVFVRGTTEAINLVAGSFGKQLKAGDEIILTTMEHHSNIVPWVLLKEQLGIVIKEIPVRDDGTLDLHAYQQLLSDKTRLLAITHVSNALGTINPIKEMIMTAHEHGVPVLIDGAQAVPHFPVNVVDLDCDFYAFSGHKLYGPSGIGVLYGKKEFLDHMSPYQGGGDMIETVAFNRVTFAKVPQKFEAGTPHIAGAVGLGAAIDYVQQIGLENIFSHEQQLLNYAERELTRVPGLRMIGSAHPKVGVISFVIDGLHPHDIATILDHHQVAVRAGHHCAMPLMERFKVPATVRLSLGIYNDEKDIDALINGLLTAKRLFQ